MPAAMEFAGGTTSLSPTATTPALESGPPHQHYVGSLFLTGSADLIDAHSAHEQVRAPDGRRIDREYPAPYEGEQPEWWPEGRGVPPYRPLNRNQDPSNRPWAATPPEVVFVRTMLSGVLFIGFANRAWRSTFGKVTDKVWVYPTGGYF
ncbi:hypothetical protein T439DRAFT_377646 [Meredithblackwellia eburnea MCA 4105]